MHWTERDGVWVSGPYMIELLAPEMWALSRSPEDSETSPVEVENWWTGRSLREMKRRAESIEADKHRVRNRNRQLWITGGAMVVLFFVTAGSGPVAGILAIAATITVMYGLARAVDYTLRQRPWDNLPEIYQ